MKTSEEIEQRDCISKEEFRERYLLERKPVVLRGGARSLPAVNRWNLDFFARQHGSSTVPIDGAMSGNRMPLADYITQLRARASDRSQAGSLYLRNLMIFEQFPELRQDFEMPWMAQPNWLQSRLLGDLSGGSWKFWVELFISGANSRFPFVHIDPYYTHAWSIQISGRKRFWLWKPLAGQFEQLVAGRMQRRHVGDIGRDTSFESYLPGRQSYSVVLEPGDLAFVPAGWWHTTETSEESVTLGGNFVDSSNWSEFKTYYLARNPHHTVRQALARQVSVLAAPLLLRARNRLR